jgi:uncharacterized tellurite resistance protein B-like protein
MKSILIKLFQPMPSQEKQTDNEHALRVSTAALLIEASRADFEQDASELAHMRQLLAQQFSLDDGALDELMDQAHQEADDLISLQHITRVLNEQFDQAMKTRIIEMMWQVVFADGVKCHYEEHLIRQVAELLYVPHSEFIRARHKAEQVD